jgi:hypothetical protein
MKNSRLRSRIKTRARVIFPWLSTSKTDVTVRRATKSLSAYAVSSILSSTSSLSLDQRSIEQPVISRCWYEELGQPHSLEQPAIRSTPQLPIMPALDQRNCEEILGNHVSSYTAGQHPVISLRQATSPAHPTTASDCVFATVELLEHILLSLPTENLFVLQRVSKTWKQTVAQSVAMQVKMFLRCSPKRHEIWEMVDEQLDRVPIMQTEYDVVDFDHLMRTRTSVTRQEPHHKQYVKLRKLAQAGDTIKSQDHLILPLTLNPLLRPSVSEQRWPLVDKDEHGVYSTIRYANTSLMEDLQRITYIGSVATLKRAAAMYVSDPPWPEATMEITMYCGERGAEKHLGFIEAVIHGIDIESDGGLKMADILQGLSKRGTRYSEIIHGPLRDESSSDLSPYRDEVFCQGRVTLAELPMKVKLARWKDMWMKRAIKVTLRFPPIDGLMPIVPTEVEMGALTDC